MKVVSSSNSGSFPKVVILATGGTIASAGASATQLTDYKDGVFNAEQLISAVPATWTPAWTA